MDVVNQSIACIQIRGNQLLVLNDPKQIWQVQSGSLALFAVPIKNGVVEGERRYLFTVSAGQALFGMALSDRPEALGMVAVALEPTELSGLCLPHPELRPLIESWIEQLCQIEGLPQPQVSTVLPQTQYISLLKGQVYQPQNNQTVWVQIQQGKAFW